MEMRKEKIVIQRSVPGRDQGNGGREDRRKTSGQIAGMKRVIQKCIDILDKAVIFS